jgi:hypothetical protein
MEAPEIENLVLANHVEAVNGLLYISGGGWTDHWRPAPAAGGPPIISHLGVAVTLTVPAAAPTIPQPLTVVIEDDQGRQVAGLQTMINQSRPAGLGPDQEQRIAMALSFNIVFPAAGLYRLAATMGISAPRMLAFRVHDVAPPAPDLPTVN